MYSNLLLLASLKIVRGSKVVTEGLTTTNMQVSRKQLPEIR